MTAALICDQCGRIATDGDPTNRDPTKLWVELRFWPVVNGGLARPIPLNVDVTVDGDDTYAEPELVTFEEEDDEPERHFCGLGCLTDWVAHRDALEDGVVG